MRDILYLAWRYLVYNRIKTGILILSIALIAFLPIGLMVLVSQSSESLTARAMSTPLVIGEKGSPLELTLNSLYFESNTPPEITYSEVKRVRDTNLAMAIPVYNRFKSQEFPIVGTTIDYIDFRSLEIAHGRKMALLGECVIGSDVARSLGLTVGDSLISTPENAFDLAGIYPLKMQIVGMLEPSGTPDDRAIITDLKTTWIIAGLAHGHQDLTTSEAASHVRETEDGNIIANASVIEYNEITDDNRDSFHFHGDPSVFPITAVIALPYDTKSGTLLQGKYLSDNEQMQILRPSHVIDDLLETILTIQNYILAGAALTGGATLMTAILVFVLSLRLRQGEIETMHRIGVSSYRVILLLGTEIAAVLISGIALATTLTLLLAKYGDYFINHLLF